MPSHADDDLRAMFRGNRVPEEMLPSGLQRRFVDEFAALYARFGLMTGAVAPLLCDCCSNAASCWTGIPREDVPDWCRVSLPWIGPDYPKQDGVVVLSLNMNTWGGPAAEFFLAAFEHEHFGLGERKMRYNNPTYRGSLRAYGMARSAASVLDKLDGREVGNHEDAHELVDPMRRIARWNAVKCSPANGKRSRPRPAMVANCPEMLLRDELRIAKPKVLLTFGVNPGDVFAAVGRIAGFEPVSLTDKTLRRGRLNLDDRSITVLGLYHPSIPTWWVRSQAALVRYLRSANSVDG